MSTYTKINVRSPFYLNLTEPSFPTPEYTCSVADLQGFAVDNQGVITLPEPAVGTIDSFTSSDSDFANNKFAVETADTSRTITVTLLIPPGFSNSSDVFFDCNVSTTQPGTSGTVAPCTGGPTTSGTISTQTLTKGGSSVDIDLAGFFTSETTYAFSNPNPNLVTAALSGSVLTLSPNNIGGSTKIHALGRDNSYPATCEAVQSFTVTVNVTEAFSCTINGKNVLQGGSITAAGVITKPSSIANVGTIRTVSGDPSTNITTYPANTGSASRTVTLFFDLTAPSSYSNAGATVECSADLTQAGTALPVFTEQIAGLTGQSIAANGSVNAGQAAQGVIKTPVSGSQFDPVAVDTIRDVTFPVTIPSGFQNAGTDLNISVRLIQPASPNICGSNTFFISSGVTTFKGHCGTSFSTTRAVTSTGSSLNTLDNTQICRNGTPFDGKNLYYGVALNSSNRNVGDGASSYYVIQIDNTGRVLQLGIASCESDGNIIV
tara:strand:+ start:10135 stop:11604 length:1470 start_codon:yes stop_codon:yes gene_type:complete